MEERRWEDLDIDCLSQVFGKVGLKHLLEDVPLVCKSWYGASLTPSCWTILDFPSVVGDGLRGSSHSNLIKLVVDRSGGSAVKVVLPLGCTFKDLEYVSDKCPAVRDLAMPYVLTSKEKGQCVSKIIGKFKKLQMLKMREGYDLEHIVTEIGNHSENFEELEVNNGHVGNKEASAIVTFLPNIKYLVLKQAFLPHQSLVHILDGCRNLVLLDVRNCIGFDEDDPEIIMRASRIKTFRPQGSRLYYDDEDDDDDLVMGTSD